MEKMDLLITGVGGQGVVLASDIIGETALASGFDVKKTDTLGMAQRGGSVVSHVRLAEKVWSPLIKEGEVDLLLALEKLEAARWSHYLKSDAIVIINNYEQPPLSVSLGQEKYPTDKDIAAALKRRTDQIYFIDGNERAKELGNVRTLNIYMLGCFSAFAPLDIKVWEDSISRRMPEKLLEINLKAFAMGRKEIEGVRIGKS
ncbi:MAG: indolepyruvate oxidoreductase [Chloroflexi bacterium RBG_13_51_52]|nr:MAG: indolepyruvate oxidoreductase [Chloroflexi bacterium RBG_13_51_52]